MESCREFVGRLLRGCLEIAGKFFQRLLRGLQEDVARLE